MAAVTKRFECRHLIRALALRQSRSKRRNPNLYNPNISFDIWPQMPQNCQYNSNMSLISVLHLVSGSAVLSASLLLPHPTFLNVSTAQFRYLLIQFLSQSSLAGFFYSAKISVTLLLNFSPLRLKHVILLILILVKPSNTIICCQRSETQEN